MATQTIAQPAATAMKKNQQTAAELLIRSLVERNVKYIFGIPGGRIMPTFDVLRNEGPQLIVCWHEQNAAFMAAAIGRLTGRPGVCLVTSGPGTGNLVTGAATATTEGDPMVAIGGVVSLPDTLKQTHQSMFHLHFLRQDKQAGGHALDNRIRAGKVQTCTVHDLRVELPTSAEFLTTNFGDPALSEKIKAAEG